MRERHTQTSRMSIDKGQAAPSASVACAGASVPPPLAAQSLPGCSGAHLHLVTRTHTRGDRHRVHGHILNDRFMGNLP